MTTHLPGVYLRRPTWITPSDALLARYRAQLPALFLEKHRYRRRLTFALALLSPFALFFGNVPLHVLLIPLSFAPILWCASLAGTACSTCVAHRGCVGGMASHAISTHILAH